MSNPFGELIGSGEGGYNSYNRGTVKDDNGNSKIIPSNRKIDFSKMTIAELQRYQNLPSGDPNRVFAVGKYQLIPTTLKEGVRRLQIEQSEQFTSELQDRLFGDYILKNKCPKIYAYITGAPDTTLRDVQKAVSKEWASVEDPDTPGHAYALYEKYGNKMHTTAAQVAAALDEMRMEYKAQIDKGLSAEEAWRATMTMGPGQVQHVAKAHTARHPAVGGVLREGVRSPAVGELQVHLNKLGYTDSQGRALTIDQDFGRDTRHAVETFQRNQHLRVDGVAGPNTWAALQEATRAASIVSTTATLAPAAIVEPAMVTFPQVASPPDLDVTAIRTLQQHLNTLHHANHHQQGLSVTGIYDDATRAAVVDFQQTQGLPSTGLADPATRRFIEARATIAEMQQSASRYTGPALGTSLFEVPVQTPSAPSATAQTQPSVPIASPHDVTPASFPTPSVGYASPAPQTIPEPVAPTAAHSAPASQDALAAMQAQLQAMQRQMEAMTRQREQEREKERAQEASRTTASDPTQHASREARSAQATPAHAAQLLSYSNPDHPQHALYARLKELLPQGTSQARLEQSTAACNVGGFRRPEQLDEIHVVKGAVHFLSTRPDVYASIDMTQPASTVEQTAQHTQGYDQQQMQWRAQFEEQQREINARGGPTLHGPTLH